MPKMKPIGLLTGAIVLTMLATPVLAITMNAGNTNSNTVQTSAVTADTNPSPASDAAAAVSNADKQDAAETDNETQDKAKETAEKAALAAKATVTEQEAVQIAQNAYNGYTFKVADLGSENGVIAYELTGTDAAGKTLEVHVDAGSGALLQQSDSEHDD